MKTYDNEEADRRNALLETYLEMEGGGKNALRLAQLELAKSGDLDSVLDVARAKQVCGDIDAALAEMNGVINKNPEHARAYAVRAFLYESLCVKDREKAMKLEPIYEEIFNQRSNGDEEES